VDSRLGAFNHFVAVRDNNAITAGGPWLALVFPFLDDAYP